MPMIAITMNSERIDQRMERLPQAALAADCYDEHGERLPGATTRILALGRIDYVNNLFCGPQILVQFLDPIIHRNLPPGKLMPKRDLRHSDESGSLARRHPLMGIALKRAGTASVFMFTEPLAGRLA